MKNNFNSLKEEQRINSLRALNILDSQPEKEFDEIVFIASQVCHVPIAYISLIDDKRLWLKAKQGIFVSEIHKEISFCVHTILNNEMMIVNDTSTDSRFVNNPLVIDGPQVKFYAGVPLLSPDAFPIGTLCVIDNKARELSENQKKCLLALSNQITRLLELKVNLEKVNKSEENLTESTRLSNIGEMASGMAHEINNPLTIIQGKAKTLRRQMEGGVLDLETGISELKKIETAVERIARVIKGLRTYSGGTDNDPYVSANFATIIEDTLELCSERFKNHFIEIKIECDPTIMIECKKVQISQILLNLLSNSYDAIQNLSEKWVRISVSAEDEIITLIFEDSGKGIPSTIAAKMMLPFFTTKEVGKGTGLGLSISKGIAESHRGSLVYEPQAVNTRFILKLPCTSQSFVLRTSDKIKSYSVS